MRGDKTIVEGADSLAERKKERDRLFSEARTEYLEGLKPGGFCGICSTRYKGYHINHKCNLKKW